MKIKVLCDKSGKIRSIAMLNPAPVGEFTVEVEGGGPVYDLEVDAGVIEPEALMGRRGAEAQKVAYEKVRNMMPR